MDQFHQQRRQRHQLYYVEDAEKPIILPAAYCPLLSDEEDTETVQEQICQAFTQKPPAMILFWKN